MKSYNKLLTNLGYQRSVNTLKRSKAIKGFIGPVENPSLSSNVLFLRNTKKVVYSFNQINNFSPILTKTEYLLKSVFKSLFSLISRPVYYIKHDKIIIQLFVYLSPKIDKYLDSSTVSASYKVIEAPAFARSDKNRKFKNVAGFSANSSSFKISQFLKFKSLRPNAIEILKSQSHKAIVEKKNNSYFDFKFRPNSNREALPPFLPNLSFPFSLSPLAKPGLGGKAEASAFNLSKDSASTKTDKMNSPLDRSGAQRAHELDNNTYLYSSFVSNFKSKLEKLCLLFEKIFNKKVEFEIIKAQFPFQDSNILAQILGYNANKYKFRRMIKILIPRAVIRNPSTEKAVEQLTEINPEPPKGGESAKRGFEIGQPFSYLPPFLGIQGTASVPGMESLNLKDKEDTRANASTESSTRLVDPCPMALPIRGEGFTACTLQTERLHRVKQKNHSYLSGMNIKLAGRLMTQSMRPRFTVQSIQEGSLARVKVHYIEKSRFTGKNKRGAFSFTVTISHVFN